MSESPDPSRIIEPANAAEVDAIWKQYDSVVLVTEARSAASCIHLPAEDDGVEPACDHHKQSVCPEHWKRKELAVFPPGYKEVCKWCLDRWRRGVAP